MIVTLDGRKLDQSFSANASLQSLVDEVRARHLRDRLVIEVSVDGEVLVNPELSRRLGEPLAAASQIDLSSGDPRELACAALREVGEQLEIASEAHVEVAEELRAGRGAKAVDQYGALLTVWQAMQNSIRNGGYVVQRDFGTLEVEGRTVAQHLQDLASRLRDVRDAFEARDFVLLADILKYEMPEVCRHWRMIVQQIAEAISA